MRHQWPATSARVDAFQAGDGAGTIEERIIELHHRKRDLANSLLEGTEAAAKISEEELIGLLSE